MLMALAVVAVPASAVDYYLPGEWNGWTPNADMMTDNGDGTYTRTMTGLTPNARYEFKVLQDGDWANPAWPGANCWFYADGDGEVTINFNTNVVSDGWLTDQYRIGVSTDLGTWTVVGGFGGAGLPNWDNAGAGMQMAAQGGGIYKLHLYLPADTYEWKIVDTGSWDSICEDERSINTANASVTTTPGLEYVNFYVDAYTGVVKTEVVPEPATIALLGLGGLALLRRKR
jgi:hypothetical protein